MNICVVIILAISCLSLSLAAPAVARKKRGTVKCQIPGDLHQRLGNIASRNPHEMYTLGLPDNPQNVQSISPEFIKLHHMYGDTFCPSQVNSTGDANSRSLCPWYYVVNHDKYRFPPAMAQAECRCSGCIGLGQNDKVCEKVWYNVRVLRRLDECDSEGNYKYIESWQQISVGCTCASRRVATVSNESPEGTPPPAT
ncbi:interleukin 17-like protein [Lingula anatina]|uniref:Interleukin 17-like protein n=1 Tax=Lingula anatina TaxID=7574 RepID=A0A1S3JGD9_LINAN|nr:interleukin 17-like protein [Lingula anatina]|eukprot:XP_013408964.1 interleukin 17-like protein [Lingula anatina]